MKIHVSILADKTGQKIDGRDMEWSELNKFIQTTSAPIKEKLKWLKLARFGTKRSEHNSLRTDDNTLASSGIELDYDAGTVPMQSIIAKLRKAKIKSIVYPTASYTPEKQKYRVLCPFSKELPPKERAKHVARINGLCSGIFADESFVVSQGFLFGAVLDPKTNKPPKHYKVVSINGDYVDKRDDLDKGAMGKSNTRDRTKHANGHDFNANASNLDALAKNIREGVNLHASIRDSAAKLARQGYSEDKIIEYVQGEMVKSKAPRDKRYRDRYKDIPRSVKSGLKKFKGKDINDFIAYKPLHSYIFIPTREMWPASSVNTEVAPVTINIGKKPMLANVWLDYNRAAHQMTWAPGMPLMIPDKLVQDGGWIGHQGVNCFNLYRPPVITEGDPEDIQPWRDHIKNAYPLDWEHITQYCAFKVQHPEKKINHALMLGGMQGVGKDTILEPVKHAIGPWNWQEVKPTEIFGDFNSYVKAVMLRINEGRDLGEVNRYQLYEHTKVLCAAPPDVLRCNEKHLREHAVFNVMGVIITTNYKTDGIYLPMDDRRHYCAWSDCKKEDFSIPYFDTIWKWYEEGPGLSNVAAYLREYDLSDFNPKAPPKKTEAWHSIVNTSAPPENSELADILDGMGNPIAVTLDQVAEAASGSTSDFYNWITDRKNRRAIPHRMETCGYQPVRNKSCEDGLWVIKGKRQVVYGNQSFTENERCAAIAKLGLKLRQ